MDSGLQRTHTQKLAILVVKWLNLLSLDFATVVLRLFKHVHELFPTLLKCSFSCVLYKDKSRILGSLIFLCLIVYSVSILLSYCTLCYLTSDSPDPF